MCWSCRSSAMRFWCFRRVAKVPQAIIDQKAKEDEKKRKKEQMKALTMGEKRKKAAKPPPPDQFVLNHPYIAPMDMDIIKLTAQFVARNGQKFLIGLTQRESRNPQFDFLKPTHALFGYFTSLVDSYTKCLMPNKEHCAAHALSFRVASWVRLGSVYRPNPSPERPCSGQAPVDRSSFRSWTTMIPETFFMPGIGLPWPGLGQV